MVEIMLFKVHVTKNMWHQIPGLSSFEMTDTNISSLNKPSRLQTPSKSFKKEEAMFLFKIYQLFWSPSLSLGRSINLMINI